MKLNQEQGLIDFYRYPAIGPEDWRYVWATAQVRVLETLMLTRSTLLSMADASDLGGAVELLGSTEYAMGGRSPGLAQIEEVLLGRRGAVRELFIDLMLDSELVEILKAREDFANMRLAVRRVVTERPVGTDYSDAGSVPAEQFEEIFEQEDYESFPDYLQEAVEEAILGYYQNKDIRQIDYGIDKVASAYKLGAAADIGSVFLLSLFRTQIDLTNIRTMLRVKMADRDEKNLFIPGGFVETDRFVHGLEVGYEALATLFYPTPYHGVVDGGVSYLMSEQSFLHLEKGCQDYLMGFLKTTRVIAAGPQPVIAYLIMKENEIRTVRMVLTCKKNRMDTKFILDRLGEN
ncbi:MAG: V-type ATPase subunit [Planctomycetota bacterium]|jgi:V/A-type H+-transporting ATPase subunit C